MEPRSEPRTRRVRSGHVELHVAELGTPGAPPVLLVHGFPDRHEVYSEVMADLCRDHHVVAFDLRGAGRSSRPSRASEYVIDKVLVDFSAVIDAVFEPGTRVHLVGHDWGSCLSFSYLCDPAGKRRVQSFTSVSGPHLGLMWEANMSALRSRDAARRRAALSQTLASSYAFAFQLPWLPELALWSVGPRLYRRALVHGGAPPDDRYLRVTRGEVALRALGTLNLYRANVLHRPEKPAKNSLTTPLLVLVPERDPFVHPHLYERLGEYATQLEVRRIAAGHWLPRSHPKLLAGAVREHAARVGAARQSCDP